MIRRQAVLIIGALEALMVFGTSGFVLIEGWPVLAAIYMTSITLSTVGFQEVHPLTTAG